MEVELREGDIEKPLKYNILERKKDRNIQNWKSYPGVGKIIDMAIYWHAHIHFIVNRGVWMTPNILPVSISSSIG